MPNETRYLQYETALLMLICNCACVCAHTYMPASVRVCACFNAYVFLCASMCVFSAEPYLHLGQEVDGDSFGFKAARLLDLHPQVLHIGQDHILHGGAETQHVTQPVNQ